MISNFASACETEALALNEALKLSGQLPENILYCEDLHLLEILSSIIAKRTAHFIGPCWKPDPIGSGEL